VVGGEEGSWVGVIDEWNDANIFTSL